MKRRTKLILASAAALAAITGGSGYALGMMQADAATVLRASGKVGEQVDGYLGIVGAADAGLRAQVNAVNIKRRAYYTELAARRGAKIEEVAATTACELLASKIAPGQYYRLADGSWRQREGNAPVPRPGYCGS